MLERDRQFMLFGLSPDRSSRRGVWLFLVIWFGALLFAGLLAPLVYAACSAMAQGNPDGVAASLVARDFDKFVDRCRYLPIIILLPWLMVVVGLIGRSAGFLSANDLKGRPDSLRWLMGCLIMGAALAALIISFQLTFTWYHTGKLEGTGDWLKAIGGAAVSAVLIGVAEEILFRSLIFRIFYTGFRPKVAILLSSMIYAYLHFRAPDSLLAGPNADPGFLAGLHIAGLNAVGIFLNFDFIEFANYTSLGALLCVLYLRSRSLWAPIGLHAGIVFVMLIYQKAVWVHPDELRWLLAGGGLTDGILPLILTLALTVVFALRLPVSRH
ncbi:CPBP family intramembrane glutamic endopeptidase [Cerasicoccus frondis]|uniref:CPBP family intramembrane glutamic endopeptidase n=1 Tax=Cerasicoccus frondis TaxID=490090 RepID=UPI00285261B8|nr:CPBP family intramembrane glutamic endopeptidase [Cerasicoccus frondis]